MTALRAHASELRRQIATSELEMTALRASASFVNETNGGLDATGRREENLHAGRLALDAAGRREEHLHAGRLAVAREASAQLATALVAAEAAKAEARGARAEAEAAKAESRAASAAAAMAEARAEAMAAAMARAEAEATAARAGAGVCMAPSTAPSHAPRMAPKTVPSTAAFTGAQHDAPRSPAAEAASIAFVAAHAVSQACDLWVRAASTPAAAASDRARGVAPPVASLEVLERAAALRLLFAGAAAGAAQAPGAAAEIELGTSVALLLAENAALPLAMFFAARIPEAGEGAAVSGTSDSHG
jgi:hypothetical protein